MNEIEKFVKELKRERKKTDEKAEVHKRLAAKEQAKSERLTRLIDNLEVQTEIAKAK